MKSIVLQKPLVDALARTNKQQKFVAVDSDTPQSTFSDHVKGKKGVTTCLQF